MGGDLAPAASDVTVVPEPIRNDKPRDVARIEKALNRSYPHSFESVIGWSSDIQKAPDDTSVYVPNARQNVKLSEKIADILVGTVLTAALTNPVQTAVSMALRNAATYAKSIISSIFFERKFFLSLVDLHRIRVDHKNLKAKLKSYETKSAYARIASWAKEDIEGLKTFATRLYNYRELLNSSIFANSKPPGPFSPQCKHIDFGVTEDELKLSTRAETLEKVTVQLNYVNKFLTCFDRCEFLRKALANKVFDSFLCFVGLLSEIGFAVSFAVWLVLVVNGYVPFVPIGNALPLLDKLVVQFCLAGTTGVVSIAIAQIIKAIAKADRKKKSTRISEYQNHINFEKFKAELADKYSWDSFSALLITDDFMRDTVENFPKKLLNFLSLHLEQRKDNLEYAALIPYVDECVRSIREKKTLDKRQREKQLCRKLFDEAEGEIKNKLTDIRSLFMTSLRSQMQVDPTYAPALWARCQELYPELCTAINYERSGDSRYVKWLRSFGADAGQDTYNLEEKINRFKIATRMQVKVLYEMISDKKNGTSKDVGDYLQVPFTSEETATCKPNASDPGIQFLVKMEHIYFAFRIFRSSAGEDYIDRLGQVFMRAYHSCPSQDKTCKHPVVSVCSMKIFERELMSLIDNTITPICLQE